jgi:hypothetical protein
MNINRNQFSLAASSHRKLITFEQLEAVIDSLNAKNEHIEIQNCTVKVKSKVTLILPL